MKILLILFILTCLMYQIHLKGECDKKGGYYQIATAVCLKSDSVIK